MPVLDGQDKVCIGVDLARQLVAKNLNEVIAGQQPVRVPMGQSLLGQEHQSHHDQRHRGVLSLPTPNLIVRHAAAAFCVFKSALGEMPCPLHRN